MADDIDNGTGPKNRQRLLKQLDKMVESGRVTDPEADRLRSASGPGGFDAAIRDIRVRHAGSTLEGAVADGTLSQDDADGFLERLRNGEHSRSLRAHLAKFRPGSRSRDQAPGSPRPAGGGQDDSSAAECVAGGAVREEGFDSAAAGA